MYKKISLFTLICALCAPSAYSAIRVGGGANSGGTRAPSYAGAYQQVAMAQQIAAEQTAAAFDTSDLPVRVASEEIAHDIRAGGTATGVTVDKLRDCAMIFPGGKFAWDVPTAGLKAGGGATCVAEVEMRKIRGEDDRKIEGQGDIILARAFVAAGDSIDCNISRFPMDSYLPDAGRITFPADREPTLEDVKKAMNQEQKQGAGIKTAAGTLLGGIGGFLLNKDNPDKWKTAAIGATAVGGTAYVSTQVGKQAGDTIMGAGVNAVAGGLIGNISGIGGSVLQIVDCVGEDDATSALVKGQKCLLGVIDTGELLSADTKDGNDQGKVGFFSLKTEKTMECRAGTLDQCKQVNLIGYTFKLDDARTKGKNNLSREELKADATAREFLVTANKHCLVTESNAQKMEQGGSCEEVWYMVDGAKRSSGAPTPVAIAGWTVNKAFGTTDADWMKWKGNNIEDASVMRLVHLRNAGNKIGELVIKRYPNANIADFYPLYQEASDGAMIDINNKARMKATAIGAAGGAALGGFAAFQGAGDDIENRWVMEYQAYKDSLQKIYCATGTRHLASYNEPAFIPNMQ